jgi:GDP-L-fucose synthase
MVKDVIGYSGEVVFDAKKPDGTPKKLLDSNKINTLGWCSSINLRDGLISTYKEFVCEYGK